LFSLFFVYFLFGAFIVAFTTRNFRLYIIMPKYKHYNRITKSNLARTLITDGAKYLPDPTEARVYKAEWPVFLSVAFRAWHEFG
jgi:hypothetical protein